MAQHIRSGVFLSSRNYLDAKLSYSFSCDSSEGKINLHHFFTKNYIEVILNGRTIKLNKDSIFGYRNCDSVDFRFYQNDDNEYEILENLYVTIYRTELKVKLSPSSKTFELVPTYFFSNGINGNILLLNVSNLKMAFPNNTKFHNLLEMESNDNNIAFGYDSVHHMYRVNYLFDQSLN